MMEQVYFEGRQCPVVQQFVPRDQWLIDQVRHRAEQQKINILNKQLDRMAAESSYMDKYELGIPTL